MVVARYETRNMLVFVCVWRYYSPSVPNGSLVCTGREMALALKDQVVSPLFAIRVIARAGRGTRWVATVAQVLVIEDDRDTRTFLSEFLSDDGHVTDEAAEGLTGLKMAKQIVPDVILLDVLMPKLDGFQVLEALRTNDRTTGIPVVMLSGQNDMAAMARAFHLGASDYLTKPCSRADVTNAVNLAAPKPAFAASPKNDPHRDVAAT